MLSQWEGADWRPGGRRFPAGGGLVQREGALWAQRVVVSPTAMSINAACGSENHTTSRPLWKYTPSIAYGDVSPGGGDLLSAVFFT